MTSYQGIFAVSSTLESLLAAHVVPPAAGVSLKSPWELGRTSKDVSLWLYRATRNPDLLNHPPERPAPNQVARHPVPIDLHYLVTPMNEDPASKHEALGRCIQTFNDHASVRGAELKQPLVQGRDELRVMLEALSSEDLTRIWNALSMPFQVSASYHVQLVTIDSDHPPVQSGPVTVRRSTYDQIVSVS
jgi:hypothetical protein